MTNLTILSVHFSSFKHIHRLCNQRNHPVPEHFHHPEQKLQYLLNNSPSPQPLVILILLYVFMSLSTLKTSYKCNIVLLSFCNWLISLSMVFFEVHLSSISQNFTPFQRWMNNYFFNTNYYSGHYSRPEVLASGCVCFSWGFPYSGAYHLPWLLVSDHPMSFPFSNPNSKLETQIATLWVEL